MGWLKKFINYTRESNEEWDYASHDSAQRNQARDLEEQQRLQQQQQNSEECCANCMWFYPYESGRYYWCRKHDFCFNFNEAKYHGITRRKTCSHFCKK